jgi:hypothetical protein
MMTKQSADQIKVKKWILAIRKKPEVKKWLAIRNQIKVKKWLAIRKKAGRKIDPETAEITYWHRQETDPYGIYPEPPKDYDCVGRAYFARSPGSDIWVWFGDLPAATCAALCKNIKPVCRLEGFRFRK